MNLYRKVYASDDADFLEGLILKPQKAFGVETRLVRVLAVSSDQIVPNDYDSDGESVQNVQSGTRLRIHIADAQDLDWCYIPCNYKDSLRSDEFRRLFVRKFDTGFDSRTLSDFTTIFNRFGDKSFRKLKEVYCAVEGNINENSMTVYSGATKTGLVFAHKLCHSDSDQTREVHSFEGSPFDLRSQPNGTCADCRPCPACVYTGDVNLNVARVREWYKDYWDNVGTIQVPHHGSRLSFEPTSFSEGRYCCPISCSNKCYYKHPHASVTNALIRSGNFPIRVTESFKLVQHINFSQGMAVCFEI